MPASNANPGFGCMFVIGNGQSTEVYSDLAEVRNIPSFGTTHRTAEVTHMSSPNGWVEHIGLGLKEGKAFSLALNFVADNTDQILLYRTRVESGVKANYGIDFTDDAQTTVRFRAIINDADITHDRDSQADATISVLPTGGYSWGTAA